MSLPTLLLLTNATLETLYMVFLSALMASFFGIPLGIILYGTRKGNLFPHLFWQRFLNALVNMTRSVPFVILMIAVIPLTRLLVGSSIGTNASIVPLSLCAIPFVARVVENALLQVNPGLIEAAISMGATPLQIIKKVLIPESMSGMINGITLTIVNLIGFSAMAGAIGGGGLGDLAIRYGYQRFDMSMMFLTIAIMIILVQIVQWSGDYFVKKLLRA